MAEAQHNGYQAVFGDGEPIPVEVLGQRLRHCGESVKVYAGARLVGAERLAIGDFSQIDEGVRVFAGAGVEIGRHVHLAFGSSISGGGSCRLDNFVSIGAGTRIITGTDVPDGSGLNNPTVPAAIRAVKRGRVVVESHVVLFTGVIVLPDVTIGEGAVVAAGSLVHRDLKSWGIYAGNPLVQIGVRPSETVLLQAAALASEIGGGVRQERA